MKDKQLTHFDFPKDMLQELLRAGYGKLEIGYYDLPDGDKMVATYTQMPHCSGEMVNWWFGSYLTNTQSYQLWHPDHTTFRWNDQKKPGTCVGATHISEEVLGGETVPMEITFFDSADLFDPADLERGKIRCALTAEIRKPDGTLYAMFLHIVRETYYGCEMRNRFWLIHCDEAGAAGLMQHNLEEMGNLAEILPRLYHNQNR